MKGCGLQRPSGTGRTPGRAPGHTGLAARPGVQVGCRGVEAHVRLPRGAPRGAETRTCGVEKGLGWDSDGDGFRNQSHEGQEPETHTGPGAPGPVPASLPGTPSLPCQDHPERLFQETALSDSFPSSLRLGVAGGQGGTGSGGEGQGLRLASVYSWASAICISLIALGLSRTVQEFSFLFVCF